METSLCRLFLGLLLVIVTFTEAANIARGDNGSPGYLAMPRMGRAATYLAFPRMGRSSYLAFPRMGRSPYLAFPRMGRSEYYGQPFAMPRRRQTLTEGETFQARGSDNAFASPRSSESGSDAAESDVTCCSTGLKTEWLLQGDGKTTTQNVCPAESCCQGLQEILDQKPDGAFYSLCIPSCSVNVRAAETSADVLKNLNTLLRQ